MVTAVNRFFILGAKKAYKIQGLRALFLGVFPLFDTEG